MAESKRRRRGFTDEQRVYLDELLAECRADEDVGRRLAEAWLAMRRFEARPPSWWGAASCDGWSTYLAQDCVATWQPGPRRLRDPDVALVTGRRCQAGSFEIRALDGFTGLLQERCIPYVLVRPPYPYRWAYEPEQLVHGWEASQAVVRLLETRAHEAATQELVWHWWHGDDAEYLVDRHRCYVRCGSVLANDACLLTWAPARGRSRIALLSARRYARRSFEWLICSALRKALELCPFRVREVVPHHGSRWVPPSALLDAWAAGRPRMDA